MFLTIHARIVSGGYRLALQKQPRGFEVCAEAGRRRPRPTRPVSIRHGRTSHPCICHGPLLGRPIEAIKMRFGQLDPTPHPLVCSPFIRTPALCGGRRNPGPPWGQWLMSRKAVRPGSAWCAGCTPYSNVPLPAGSHFSVPTSIHEPPALSRVAVHAGGRRTC